jgi:sulfotransferase
MKNYYFLAGFPRSGNTVLSSILNQNDKIYCSPLSPIPGILWAYEQFIRNDENVIRNFNSVVFDVGKNIIVNYYKNINKEVIIDRQKVWATPGNMELIKRYITEDPKIIFTVRPVLEILTSFINLIGDESYIDKEMKESGWWIKEYLTKNDNRCEYMMRPGGIIDKSLLSLNEVLNLKNKNNFHIVEYNDIVNCPQETMDKIYNFLQIPKYNHDFENIVKIEKDFDYELGYPKNIHYVRKKINKISKNPKDVLSEYIINKYSNMGCTLI